MVNRKHMPGLTPFQRTETWIFDLDNTLYPADSDLFSQIDKRMNDYIMSILGLELEDAAKLRRKYYLEYGSTLSGLMRNHGAEPERFLEYVHDVDLSPIEEAPELGQALASLPGRLFIFTNGSRRHAERVAGKLGVIEHFDDVFDIAAAGFTPKPAREAYERFLARLDVEPRAAAMFEDLPGNLESPHALGMNTVLVTPGRGPHPYDERADEQTSQLPHVHHVTDDLPGFLARVLAQIGARPEAAGAAQKNGKTIDNCSAIASQTVNHGSRKQG
jgi:putative hydrolase of the HAD superfamily